MQPAKTATARIATQPRQPGMASMRTGRAKNVLVATDNYPMRISSLKSANGNLGYAVIVARRT